MRLVAPASLLFCLASLLRAATPQAPADNLVANASFEQKLSNGWFGLWDIDPTISEKGSVVQTFKPIHSGIYALKLTPNSKNTIQPGYLSYGIAQSLPADQYRGKALQFQSWMGSMGGATAIFGVVAVPFNANAIVRFIRMESVPASTSVDKLVMQRDIFDVPDIPLQYLFVICSVQGTAGRAYFDDVVVSNGLASNWTMGQPDPGPPLTATVSVDYYNKIRDIPATMWGMNLEYPYSGYGLVDPQVGSLNSHLLSLAQDLGATSWRFPGGLFANYYHWQNGVGPPNNRPAGLVLPQTGYTDNYFGTDEALSFADSTNANLFITVNAHTGTASEAAAWVNYVNASGHHVPYWEIGNELYFYQNPADTSGPVWSAEAYAAAFSDFASAMKAADPSVRLAADIEYNLTLNGCGVVSANGCWADVVLNRAADQIDLIALHNGLAPLMIDYDAGWDARTVYAGMLAGPQQVKLLLTDLSKKIDALSPANAARIKFAMVEWGPLFQSNPGFRFVDHVKTLGSALYTAGLVKTMLEEPRVELAHAFTLVEPSTQGWIGARDGVYVPTASYYAFQLFTKHFGTHLLHTTTDSPSYDSRSMGLVPATPGVPYLDAVSSSDDAGNLYVIATNKHFDRDMVVYFGLNGYAVTGSATAWTLNGTAVDANTGTAPTPSVGYAPQTQIQPDGRFYSGGPGEVTVTATPVSASGSCFSVTLPAHSVTALVLQGTSLGSSYATLGCDSGSVDQSGDVKSTSSR
ncbi:MAG: alpha-L-arabinofuranosidase C-terminal domain-containing protein [Terriglobia bacterium]